MSPYCAIIPFSMLLLAGCHSGKASSAQSAAHGPTSVPVPQETWTEQTLTTPSMPARPVKEGPAPLVYLVETDTVIRVVDLTTNSELLNMPVLAHQIVSINPDLGVQISGATMKRGALPVDHRFGIFLESTTESVRRIGQIHPGGTTPPLRGSQP